MTIPAWFDSQLALEFGGRFSIRWSHARACFILDERIARGYAITPARLAKKLDNLRRAGKSDQADEFLHRLRHGTAPFIEIYPGSRCACEACGATVALIPHVWRYAHCEACGKDFAAVSYTLGHALLEQLRYLDLERGGDERIIADMDAANQRLQDSAMADAKGSLRDSVKDDWNRIIGIPSVGYTGPVRGLAEDLSHV